MPTNAAFREALAELLSPITQEIRDRWAAESVQFRRDVADFVANLMATTATADEPAPSQVLQGRMLEHHILKCEPEELMSPVDLADAIGERNRRAVRDAGRRLVAKGIFTAETEPYPGVEGQRVLGFAHVEAIDVALNQYLAMRHETLDDEAAAAVKQ